MSLKSLFEIGRRILKGKKESATPATGQQQKLITYEGKTKETGLELAKKEMANPPVVLKKTKALHMGDDTAPAFGSSTYDWVMRKGPGKYSADEWIDHLTTSRKENFKVFGKPATKFVRGTKKFKYDRGPFAGKEATVSKEELFDTNLAIFNEAGDLTGGLLFAAKKFGLKLDGNEIGAMIKLNPINRLKPVEFGGANLDEVAKKIQDNATLITKLRDKLETPVDKDALNDALYYLSGLKTANTNSAITEATRETIKALTKFKVGRTPGSPIHKEVNQIIGKIDADQAILKNNKVYYQNETNYTLQGGKNYRETVFRLDEDIPGNQKLRRDAGHFSDAGDNQIYHVRYDTRTLPDGKKAFLIHEVQSDVNQSIAKNLSKAEQLGGIKRVNPFQADLEMSLLSNSRSNLLAQIDDAVAKGDTIAVRRLSSELGDVNRKIQATFTQSSGKSDYFPMVEADQYGDHALKYLINKATREGVDYVAVAPFDKLSFRQGYKAGNERFYGYASGKGIGKKGSAVMPDLMKRVARFYDSKAGPIKISLSDPKLPYKKISTEKFQYPDRMGAKKINSKYHVDAVANPKSGYKRMFADDPNLYFDAFAVKVSPLMRYTQKTYKALGGLVVDMFKPIRYNRPWL
jgi:hypothetical protein